MPGPACLLMLINKEFKQRKIFAGAAGGKILSDQAVKPEFVICGKTRI